MNALTSKRLLTRLSKTPTASTQSVSFVDEDGTAVLNPMNLTQEQMRLVCHYLDIDLTILRGAGIMTTVYQKRDGMPVFATYRRFPHRLSHISGRAKHNVFGSQLHRFAVICSTWDGFTKNTSRLLHEMLTDRKSTRLNSSHW